jgi:hypothetical protein
MSGVSMQLPVASSARALPQRRLRELERRQSPRGFTRSFR